MYCIECGEELQKDSKFCTNCGSNQKVDNQNDTSRTGSEKSSGQQSKGSHKSQPALDQGKVRITDQDEVRIKEIAEQFSSLPPETLAKQISTASGIPYTEVLKMINEEKQPAPENYEVIKPLQKSSNNIINSIFKLCIIIILTWAAYSFHNYSEIGRYTSIGDKLGLVLDSKTGEIWISRLDDWGVDVIKPKRYSNPINIKSK